MKGGRVVSKQGGKVGMVVWWECGKCEREVSWEDGKGGKSSKLGK